MSEAKHIERRSYRRVKETARTIKCDLCVVGSGISGVSAALEAARAGRKVVLVDALPTLGGQAANSLVGTFCGLYSNGPSPYQLTYGVASQILQDLGARRSLSARVGRNTLIYLYDEIELSRWVERSLQDSGTTIILGAVLRRTIVEGRRISTLEVATRYGDVNIQATGYVDASGDAVLSWLSGFEVQESAKPIYGTAMISIEGVDEAEAAAVSREGLLNRLKEKADEYGLTRHDGFVFSLPGRGIALVNLTHIQTPLDAVEMSRAGIEGKRQADLVHAFLRTEFPLAFGNTRVRTYGLPGIRQTRTIKGAISLEGEDVRKGREFDDAVARCSWPIELHDSASGSHWEIFEDDHIHYVPLRAMIPSEADNVVAAGRCVDADPVALASIRVMGPCIAMGAAAAHALMIAGTGSVHHVDFDRLRLTLRDNLERRDAA